MGHQPVYWKSRNAKPTRRYEETVLTPPHSPPPAARPKTGPRYDKQRGQGDESSVTGSPMSSGTVTPTQRSPEKCTPTASPVRPKTKHKLKVAKRLEQKENADVNSHSTSEVKTNEKAAQKGEHKKSHKHKTRKEKAPDLEVIVTHFVSPSQFYLQVAEARQNGLDQLMLELQKAYKNSEYQWDTWKKGKYCAAYSPSNACWYRVKIIKVLQKSLMEVYALDYGFTETVGTSNLRSILHQFRKHRVFAFCCKLSGLIPAGGMKDWSKTACEFMQDQICNKKLIISARGKGDETGLPVDLIIEEYIDETALEPGRRTFHSVIEMMKDKGLAIPLPKKRGEQPQEAVVYPVLYYKKAEAEVKTGDSVMPVYVDYDAVIHCYTMTGDDLFQAMCDNLQQKFKYSDVPQDEQKWEKGQACAGYYEKDETWHRATILDVQPDQVQINFIDYGNSEWVGYELLRADIEEFSEIPQQTFLCTLHDIRPLTDDGKWDIKVLEHMHSEVVNKYCTITVVERNGYANEHMSVHLERNGKDYGSSLIQYGLAQRGEYLTDDEIRAGLIEHILQNSNPFKMIKPLPVGEMSQYLVTHIELPNVVYLQNLRTDTSQEMSASQSARVKDYNEQLDKLEKLSMDLNLKAPTLPVIPNPKPGMACCANFSMDHCWYRAVVIILYAETSQLLVLFVDYGNSEIVTMNMLRALPKDFLSLPCQSQRCKLAHIIHPNNIQSWTMNSLLKMTQATLLQNLNAKVTCDNPLSVELFETDSDDKLVYQSVIDAGYVFYNSSEVPSPVLEKPNQLLQANPAVTSTSSHNAQPSNPAPVKTIPEQTHGDKASAVTETTECSKGEEKRNIPIGGATDMPCVKVLREESLETSKDEENMSIESSVATVTDTTSKSWADMANESLDIDRLPELDSDSEASEKRSEIGTDGVSEKSETDDVGNVKKSEKVIESGNEMVASGESVTEVRNEEKSGNMVGRSGKVKMTQEEKQKLREERKKHRGELKVESVQYEDECFD